MEGITIKDIVNITGGRLLCGDRIKEIKDFSVDFCQGNEDSIFLPIIGENEDGHCFIEEALRINGATFTQEHDAPIAGYEDKPWVSRSSPPAAVF
jgi:UDP-N-acetylmuramoyl-tripeptide--D-alanyl-D-alanine ligase